jgi:3-deoxy-manno-octulosonate cytidylyltransferase (CMP-KDO synthetase)
MKTVVIIPSRMTSERLPEKPLRDINGKTLIRRVWENVTRVFGDDDVFVAVDDERIASHVQSFGGKFVMTDPYCASGTDRIAEALAKIDPDGARYDFVINFQGDDVNVDPNICARLVDIMRRTNADIVTVGQPISDLVEINNPNIVKIAMAQPDPATGHARCLYFSRSPIPYNRATASVPSAFWHIGLYVYHAASLKKFVSLAPGQLERTEKLEQLRALENGMRIQALVLDDTRIDKRAPADVNTAEDYAEMIKYIRS